LNEPIQPEELTELFDEDLEMWAQGGTRILPKSELQRPKPDSLPPVAYASVPPPPVVTTTSTSGTPVWAALIGMGAVFLLAAAGGGIFYAIHRATSETTESAASTSVAVTTTTTTTTSEPQQVTVTPTTELALVAAPTTTTTTTTTTATQKVTSTAIATPAPVRYGTIQTFAVGAGKPVFLDGKQIGTGGSHIKAACGKHSVSIGSGKAKTYDIPCNGTPLTVGTPDGV
jgi:hypothetical protein